MTSVLTKPQMQVRVIRVCGYEYAHFEIGERGSENFVVGDIKMEPGDTLEKAFARAAAKERAKATASMKRAVRYRRLVRAAQEGRG